MRYTYKALLFFGLTATLLLSCSDDFVNVNSQDENSENFFNTEEDYQNALIGAYDLLQSSYLNVMLGEIASDNTLAGGESATDVPGIQEIDDMIHTPINDHYGISGIGCMVVLIEPIIFLNLKTRLIFQTNQTYWVKPLF